ncbi:sensor histidine kinase [Roseateles cavernae]|uniref:sensor histidine kinase n=1 Tax=Roseateles cavernae TaxID=3153578 RepID=UPI0032E408EF
MQSISKPLRRALLGGLALATVCAALVAVWIGAERNELKSVALERGRLMARMLVNDAERSIDSATTTLATVASAVAERGPAAVPLSAGPALRELAVLDSSGRVLASSLPADVGHLVDLARLGGVPSELGRSVLGPYTPARSLQDLTLKAPVRAVSGFVPVLRTTQAHDGRRLILVALVNADAVASQQVQAIGDSGQAMLVRHDGMVLAATPLAGLAPGDRMDSRATPLSALTQGRDHGTGLEPDATGANRVLAWSASRSRLFMVVVEQAPAALELAAATRLRLTGVMAVAAVLVIGLSALAWRILRSRELALASADEATRQLEERERELAGLVRSVPAAVFRTDEYGVLTFVNDHWRALTGCAKEQALGRALVEFVPDAERGSLRTLFSPRSADLRTATATFLSRGQARRADILVVPMLKAGEVIGFAGGANDITDRWQAQQHLEQQLELNKLLVESSPYPVSMFELQGRYLSVNAAWEQFMGISRNQVLGQRVGFHMSSNEARQHEGHDACLTAAGGRASYEARVLRHDGAWRDVIVTKQLLPARKDERRAVVATFVDVTDFRSAERLTREARDAAEETSRAKSEFVANISHELRTPLQSILGFAELGSVRGASSAPKLAAMFTDIHEAGRHMLALVNDLLDVSKIDSPVGTFHLERTDLRPLVRAVVKELQPQLDRGRLRIDLQLSEAPLVAKVDPKRFQQVVRNVLANAIRFSPQGTAIELDGDVTGDGEITFSVRDQGPGIPPAELERIFEAFIQASNTKSSAGGTGLGLTICRKLIELMGGRIEAGNGLGGGAVFHIHLPVRGFQDTQSMPP